MLPSAAIKATLVCAIALAITAFSLHYRGLNNDLKNARKEKADLEVVNTQYEERNRQLDGELERITANAAIRDQDAAALQLKLDAISKDLSTTNRKLNNALSRNQNWANQPLPADISRVLNGKDAVTASAVASD